MTVPEAYPNITIASHIPSFASADLGCVTFRSRKKLAPVRLTPYILYINFEGIEAHQVFF